jgi:transaldolase
MKIFIDSADIGEIREAMSWGIVDGATTNPSLVAKTGRPVEESLVEICELVNGPVSAEVIATDAEGMIAEGRKLAAMHEHVVVKCPMTADGLVATRCLSEEGTRVNVTLIFQPAQALLAAKAGAAYVSPFVGRLDDIGEDGMAMVASIVEIFSNFDFATEVLVASVRGSFHAVEAARMGADVATCPGSIIRQMMKHPLTDLGLERFLADHRKLTG